MIFIDDDDIEKCTEELLSKKLSAKYKSVRFSKIKNHELRREHFMLEPSGVLWPFCEFT